MSVLTKALLLSLLLLVVCCYCEAICKTCDLEEYLTELKAELTTLECSAFKLNQSITILSKVNSTIAEIRTKQYNKIKSAKDYLQLEINSITDSLKNCGFLQGSMGYTFQNGSIGLSCLHYKQVAKGCSAKDGLYAIQPGSQVLSVFCDMTNSGGGWTMIAAYSSSYSGPLFKVFDDSVAQSSSPNSSFHIPTRDLLTGATQIMAVSDMYDNVITNFFTSNWTYGAYCDINSRLRTLAVTPSSTGEDLSAVCYQSSGSRPLTVTPTYYTYGRTSNNHSVGFRMGYPYPGIAGHMNFHGWVTLSYSGDVNGAFYGVQGFGPDTGFGHQLGGNGALFLR